MKNINEVIMNAINGVVEESHDGRLNQVIQAEFESLSPEHGEENSWHVHTPEGHQMKGYDDIAGQKTIYVARHGEHNPAYSRTVVDTSGYLEDKMDDGDMTPEESKKLRDAIVKQNPHLSADHIDVAHEAIRSNLEYAAQ